MQIFKRRTIFRDVGRCREYVYPRRLYFLTIFQLFRCRMKCFTIDQIWKFMMMIISHRLLLLVAVWNIEEIYLCWKKIAFLLLFLWCLMWQIVWNLLKTDVEVDYFGHVFSLFRFKQTEHKLLLHVFPLWLITHNNLMTRPAWLQSTLTMWTFFFLLICRIILIFKVSQGSFNRKKSTLVHIFELLVFYRPEKFRKLFCRQIILVSLSVTAAFTYFVIAILLLLKSFLLLLFCLFYLFEHVLDGIVLNSL